MVALTALENHLKASSSGTLVPSSSPLLSVADVAVATTLRYALQKEPLLRPAFTAEVFPATLKFVDAVATSPETLFEFGDESSSFAVGARAVATLRADAPFDAVVVYIDAEDDVDPFDPERDAFATPFSIARRRQGVLIVPERSRAPSLQVWCAAVPGDEGFRFGILASS